MRNIESEFRRADHLLYVSLKYTKTTDVIGNVLERWSSTIELCIERLLMRAKRTKRIKQIPTTPLAKVELLLKTNKDKIVKEAADLYLFFRNVKNLTILRQHEFRKNVTLLVINGKRETMVDIPQLFEWNLKLLEIIEYVRQKV